MTQNEPQNRILVLVVEMDPMCRRVMERILSDTCHVMTAHEYNDIIALLKAHDFDTLFVDNDFPHPGVMALFEHARDISPRTKRILMTGEHVENLQYFLRVGTVNTYVTRTTSRKDIEREAISPAVAWKG
jgi:DNA-binding NtrC family response regulator